MEFWLLVKGGVLSMPLSPQTAAAFPASGSVTATSGDRQNLAEAFAMEQRTVLTVLGTAESG